jgi:hypothetical protein
MCATRNFTRSEVEKRPGRLNEAIADYVASLDVADVEENVHRDTSCKAALALQQAQVHKLKAMEAAVEAAPDNKSCLPIRTRVMMTGDRLAAIVNHNVDRRQWTPSIPSSLPERSRTMSVASSCQSVFINPY